GGPENALYVDPVFAASLWSKVRENFGFPIELIEVRPGMRRDALVCRPIEMGAVDPDVNGMSRFGYKSKGGASNGLIRTTNFSCSGGLVGCPIDVGSINGDASRTRRCTGYPYGEPAFEAGTASVDVNPLDFGAFEAFIVGSE